LALAEALPASPLVRKFDENFDGASRPVRVAPPSRPLPLEFDAFTLMLDFEASDDDVGNPFWNFVLALTVGDGPEVITFQKGAKKFRWVRCWSVEI